MGKSGRILQKRKSFWKIGVCSLNIFFELHKDIPREGPGSNEATRQAIEKLNLPSQPLQIVDIGCGPGMSALELAKATTGTVLALDAHEPFVEEVKRRAAAAELSDRIEAVRGNMFALELPENHFDVIWSEGAIYIMGFAKGLTAWRPFLKNGGSLVVSELSWLTETPPQEAVDFWQENYPGMQTRAQNLATIQECGYEVLDSFVLPEAGWWDEYYNPLQARIDAMRSQFVDDVEAQAILDNQQQEIDLYRKYSDSYGYVFYLMKK
jgi:ubiquinone/menaquinone biosynthesis C-methylase UbiE